MRDWTLFPPSTNVTNVTNAQLKSEPEQPEPNPELKSANKPEATVKVAKAKKVKVAKVKPEAKAKVAKAKATPEAKAANYAKADEMNKNA